MKSSIPASALQQHIAVLGKTGSGKTYAMRGVVEQLLDAEERVAVIDPTGGWWGLKSSASGKRGGYPVVIFGGQHADLPLGATHGETLAEAIGTSSTPAIIDTSQMRVGERTRFFADFADALVRKNKGPLHLIIDEAHLFAPQGKVSDPQSGAMLHAANNLVSLGRSRGLRIILITQRPAKLHKDSLTQAETLIAMRLIAPQDRKAVEEWIKDNADEAKGREIISSLATLKTGQGWVWSPGSNVLERVSFPKIHTFDSSRAPDDDSSGDRYVLAPIDREAIAAKLKTVAADAQANDPKLLKAKVAELENKLRAKVPPVMPATTPAQLADADWQGYQRALKDAERSVISAIDSQLRVAIQGAFNLLKNDTRRIVRVAPKQKVVLATPSKPLTPAINGDGSISAPQQNLLNKLAWLEARGLQPVRKETLAAVAGVSPTSGGYFNNLGRLRAQNLIEYPTAGEVALTDNGRALAVAGDDPRPVHEHWMDVVTTPQRAILEVLIARHPEPIDKDSLAQEVGVSQTSGGYFNNLGRLRTLGAIDYPQRGRVALTRHVMP